MSDFLLLSSPFFLFFIFFLLFLFGLCTASDDYDHRVGRDRVYTGLNAQSASLEH